MKMVYECTGATTVPIPGVKICLPRLTTPSHASMDNTWLP